MNDKVTLTHCIELEEQGARLDKVLSDLLSEHSRSQIQGWIKSGKVTVDGNICTKTKQLVQLDQQLHLDVELNERLADKPQPITLDIIFEDQDILVINKPAGLVTHPGAGNQDHTLLNALLYYHAPLNQLPRGGIVHRLDKDTSGLMVVAKTPHAQQHLVEALQNREVSRTYLALASGEFISGGRIEEPIGRHPKNRVKMAVISNGKEALTTYRVKEKFHGYTLLEVSLETGRTHQIRVHMSHISHPLLGDRTYGFRHAFPKGASEEVKTVIAQFSRQALHAASLAFTHPETREMVSFEAPLPTDFTELLNHFRRELSYE